MRSGSHSATALVLEYGEQEYMANDSVTCISISSHCMTRNISAFTVCSGKPDNPVPDECRDSFL
jgi:hypothetical protein